MADTRATFAGHSNSPGSKKGAEDKEVEKNGGKAAAFQADMTLPTVPAIVARPEDNSGWRLKICSIMFLRVLIGQYCGGQYCGQQCRKGHEAHR